MSWYMQRTLPAWNTSLIKSLPKYWVILLKTEQRACFLVYAVKKEMKLFTLVIILTWEEYGGLQWVWKQQWWPAEFVPKLTGHLPLGRPLGSHCSVEPRTQKQGYSQGTTRTQQTRDYMALSGKGTFFPLLQSWGSKISNKVVPQVFLFNLKSAQNDSAPPQSSFTLRQLVCRL